MPWYPSSSQIYFINLTFPPNLSWTILHVCWIHSAAMLCFCEEWTLLNVSTNTNLTSERFWRELWLRVYLSNNEYYSLVWHWLIWGERMDWCSGGLSAILAILTAGTLGGSLQLQNGTHGALDKISQDSLKYSAKMLWFVILPSITHKY